MDQTISCVEALLFSLHNLTFCVLQQPDGCFQTLYIINAAKKFMDHAMNSALKPKIGADNPPYGLYSLILVAVSSVIVALIAARITDPS